MGKWIEGRESRFRKSTLWLQFWTLSNYSIQWAYEWPTLFRLSPTLIRYLPKLEMTLLVIIAITSDRKASLTDSARVRLLPRMNPFMRNDSGLLMSGEPTSLPSVLKRPLTVVQRGCVVVQWLDVKIESLLARIASSTILEKALEGLRWLLHACLIHMKAVQNLSLLLFLICLKLVCL